MDISDDIKNCPESGVINFITFSTNCLTYGEL